MLFPGGDNEPFNSVILWRQFCVNKLKWKTEKVLVYTSWIFVHSSPPNYDWTLSYPTSQQIFLDLFETGLELQTNHVPPLQFNRNLRFTACRRLEAENKAVIQMYEFFWLRLDLSSSWLAEYIILIFLLISRWSFKFFLVKFKLSTVSESFSNAYLVYISQIVLYLYM